jgi:hypothetical protein
MKIDKANKKNPFIAPQINKEQERKHSIRLTGFKNWRLPSLCSDTLDPRDISLGATCTFLC